MTTETEQRLEKLESHMAWQEQTIEALNQVIIELRAELDTARTRMGEALERLRRVESRLPGPADEPPPHY